jgi:hypothetical protein
MNMNLDSSTAYLSTGPSIPLVFQQGAAERMRITSNGSVGIGTGTPAAGMALEVNGSAQIDQFATFRALGAMSYHLSASKTIPFGSHYLVPFDAKDWDVSGWYDPSTSKYTPKQPGLYRFNLHYYIYPPPSTGYLVAEIYKNGTWNTSNLITAGAQYVVQGSYIRSGSDYMMPGGSITLPMNGTTDYVVAAIANSNDASAAATLQYYVNYTYFQAEYVGGL